MNTRFSIDTVTRGVRAMFSRRSENSMSFLCMHPTRDWYISIILIFVFFVVSYWWVLYAPDNVVDEVPVSNTLSNDIDIEAIRETAKIYREKEVRFRSIVGTSSVSAEDVLVPDAVKGDKDSFDGEEPELTH